MKLRAFAIALLVLGAFLVAAAPVAEADHQLFCVARQIECRSAFCAVWSPLSDDWLVCLP